MSRLLLQSHESDVLSYSDCKIAKIFWGFVHGPCWWGLTLKKCWIQHCIVTNTNKYARDQNLTHCKNVNVKTVKGFMAIIFKMSLIKKWNKWLLVCLNLYELSLVLSNDGLWHFLLLAILLFHQKMTQVTGHVVGWDHYLII